VSSLQLKVQTVLREDAGNDGDQLVTMLTEAVDAGNGSPVAVVLRPDRFELVGLGAVRDEGLTIDMFLAGMSRADVPDAGPVEAVGVAGRFRTKVPGTRRGEAPVALAFLEWSDCRWWMWRSLIDAEGRLLDESATRFRAVDGDALPAGLGRWWSLGRRSRLNVRLELRGDDATDEPVH
jgi:hypothetical protein